MNRFKIFEDCKLVRGYSRSIIYDLGRKKFEFISSLQADWFEELDNLEWSKVQEKTNDFRDFSKFLLDSEYAFLCHESQTQNFPKLENKWYYPAKVTNAILFRSVNSNFNVGNLSKELEKLGCRHIQMVFIDEVQPLQVRALLNSISKYSFRSLELVLTQNTYRQLHGEIGSMTNKLLLVYITNASKFELIRKSDTQCYNAIYIRNDIGEVYKSMSPDPNYFVVNIKMYMESLTHNTFFNRKVIVDMDDNILNAIAGKSFGNLSDTPLSEVIDSDEFQVYWGISKDMIEPCNKCEFRHMCVDSRVPVYIGNKWQYKTACNYNPLEGRWTWESEVIEEAE